VKFGVAYESRRVISDVLQWIETVSEQRFFHSWTISFTSERQRSAYLRVRRLIWLCACAAALEDVFLRITSDESPPSVQR